MGKVYDALRRAEEQRARRMGEAASGGMDGGAPPLHRGDARGGIGRPAPPGAMPSAPAREREPIWKRLWLRRARRDAEDSGALNKRRITLLQPESYAAEQFRTLRTRIDSIAASHPDHALRTVAVTSALPGDGKTTAAISLAAVTAMSVGRKVLLLDADLRQPAIHRALGLRPQAGLGEVLRGDATPEEAIVKVDGSSLEVLPVRTLPPNPAELLGSNSMRELLVHLAARYDRIVLDLPPTLGLPDAKTVSELCDGVVFVVRADATPEEDVTAAVELLDRRRILGVVLNGAERDSARYDYRRYRR